MRHRQAFSWLLFTFLVTGKTLIASGFAFGLPGQNTPPVFDFRREWMVPENEPIGSRIITVRAKDEDKEDTLIYGIEPSVYLDGSNYFTINSKNGDVFLKDSLMGQAGNTYYLFITAFDGHQTAKIEVYVRVLDADRSTGTGAHFDVLQFNSTSQQLPTYRRPFPPVNNAAVPYPRPPDPNLNPAPPRQSTTRPAPTKKKVQLPKPTNPSPPNTTAVRFSIPTPKSVPTVPTTVPPSPGDRSDDHDRSENGPADRHRYRFEMTPMTAIILVLSMILFAPVAGCLVFWMLSHMCQRGVLSRSLMKSISQKTIMMNSAHVNIDKSESNDTSISSGSGEHDYNGVLFKQLQSKRTLSNRYALDSEFPPAFNIISEEDRKWEFPRKHLTFVEKVGEGNFGHVWKYEATNICNSEGKQFVAVKTLKENAKEKEKDDLMNELHIMKMLDPHPNIITLLGCCTEKEPMFLIMEYAPFETLQQLLRNNRAKINYSNLNGQLTSRNLTSFAYQIAKGMQYLSEKKIIHRDLAARNILIGNNRVCKISDFGFARDVIGSQVYEKKSEGGPQPIRWMAIESLVDRIFTTKSDVWSFGILMWEIVTLGSTPYPGLNAEQVIRKVKEGYRMERPDHCRREMYNIMYYCWNSDPAARHSFSELVQVLEDLLASESDYIELDRFPDHPYYNYITNISGEKL